MSTPKAHEPVKLIISVFARDQGLISHVIEELSNKFGKIDFVSEVFLFDKTVYYEKEMGESLVRRFLSFQRLVLPNRLPYIKLFTNTIENSIQDFEGKRKVNIDPGYLSLYHLILATGKGYAHRPYLRDGIYADITLIYRSRSYYTLDWTYPDYSSREIIDVMNLLRKKYVFQIKKSKKERLC